jgi:hypothetical protein
MNAHLLTTLAVLGFLAPLAGEENKIAIFRQTGDPDVVRRFEQPPEEWVGAFTSLERWKGSRGFTPESQATKETGVGWLSDGRDRLFRGLRAPSGAPHAVFTGRRSADHTQLNCPDAHPRVKAGEQVDVVSGSFDITVCFADNDHPKAREVFNSFFQIFERSPQGYRPAYGLFYHKQRLRAGAWDDNPFVPGVTLERGYWYRIRFDVTLRNDGARTVLSVWPVDSSGRQGTPQVSGLMIEHRRGLRRQSEARSFPVMIGAYTWGLNGKELMEAATLISSYRQGPLKVHPSKPET